MSTEYTFNSRTGHFRQNNALIGFGYSGKGAGLLNPAMDDVHNVGPLPRGKYSIELIKEPHKGPIVFKLNALPGTDLKTRFGFLIHWDNVLHNFTASDGCIVLISTYLFSMLKSGDIVEVIAP